MPSYLRSYTSAVYDRPNISWAQRDDIVIYYILKEGSWRQYLWPFTTKMNKRYEFWILSSWQRSLSINSQILCSGCPKVGKTKWNDMVQKWRRIRIFASRLNIFVIYSFLWNGVIRLHNYFGRSLFRIFSFPKEPFSPLRTAWGVDARRNQLEGLTSHCQKGTTTPTLPLA